MLLPDPAGELGWLCQRILTEYTASGVTPLARAYTTAFLHLVQRVVEQGVTIKHDAVDIAVQFIHTNYSKPIGLDDLAQAGCVSKTHMSHCFHNRLGTSPLRYLQQVRIEAAKRLLLTTTIPINQIADEVGFGDPLYFSRVMKSSTGHSPTSYRRKNSAG
jgi:AraC-like DNA-binding protein